MNGFFVTLGCVVIAVLATLLVAPHFVDWTQHRAWFEREASSILGAQVRVGGTVDLQLLPQPVVHFEKVSISGTTKAEIRRFTLKLAATPLLRGEVRVSELAIDGAKVDVDVGEDGRIAWPVSGSFAGEQADRAVLEAVAVTNASLYINDRRTGNTTLVDAINFDGDARSLGGPYRAEGGFRIDGHPHQFRFSTARVENKAIRFKASGSRSDLPVSAEFDGLISFAGTKPVFTGRSVLMGHAVRSDPDSLPWRFEAQVKADPGRVLLSPFELAYGPDDQRAILTGAGHRIFGSAPALEVTLSARQIDLDRLFGKQNEKPAGVGSRLARLVGIAPILADPPTNSSVRLEVGGMVVGGGVVSGLRLDLAAREAGWTVKSLEATLPGTSPLRLSGAVDLTPGSERFDGTIGLESQNFSALRSWIAGPDDSDALALSPAELEAQARLSVGREGVAVEDIALTLADARLSGRFGYRAGRLDAALTASRLDLDRLLPEETRRRGLGLLSHLPESLVEATVQLDADALTIAGVKAEDVSTAVRLAGDTLAIERFSVSRLGGATVQASGQVAGLGAAPDGQIEVTAKADDLAGLTKLLMATEATRTAGEAIERRRGALAPLDLKATLAFAPEDGVAAGRVVIHGTAGDSQLDAEAGLSDVRGALTGGQLTSRIALTNPSATRILEQVGLPVLPIQEVGAGELSFTAQGPLGGEVRLEGQLVGFESRLAVSGLMRPFATEGRPAELTLNGESGNLAVLAPVLGLGLPDIGTALPLTLSARLAQGRDGAWALDDLTGELAGSQFRGNLVLVSGERLGVRGAIEASDLDFGAFISAGLGGDLQTSLGGAIWSDRPFVEPALARFEGEITLRADRGTLIPGAEFSGAQARLTFGADGFSLRDIETRMAGGLLKGTLEGRMSGQGSRRVLLRTRLENARLEEIVWRASGRPVASGNVTLTAEIEAVGRTPSSLFAQATGNGSLHVEHGEIRGLNPLAFASIIRASEAGLELKEERVSDVFAGHLASGVIPVDRADGAFAVSGGVARLRNLSFESTAASSFASARLDLGRLDIEGDWTLAVKSPVEGVGQQPPPVALTFRGPLATPTRHLDVSALLGFLNVRAFEKEVERLEAMQADILERERFSRELIRLGERRREREQAAEQARKAEEEAAKAVAAEKATRNNAAEEPTGSARPQATGQPTPLLPPSILAPIPQLDPRASPPTAPQRRSEQPAQPRRAPVQQQQQQPQPLPQPQQPVQAPPPRERPNVFERLFGTDPR